MSSETDVSCESDEVEHEDIMYPSAIPFVLMHLGCFAAIWTGMTLEAILLGIGLYWLRIFAIGAGYHRYFSHRAYSTSRAFQFVLAFLSQSTAQKSVLWWAAKHRHHHLHSDTPRTSIRRGTKASSIVTSAGSFPAGTTRPTWPRSRIWRAIPS